jgi:bifunctional DNA-binding transcriptional regulator/antitoxin component of YhaV-PrlF toxin-antitoxin module
MESISLTVREGGEIEIPPIFRERLGIESGTRLSASIFGGEIILRPETLTAKLRMIEAMRGWTAGGPSGTDILLEDRRQERERELREEGW